MPAFNFQAGFAPAVECGWKVQTIRAKRQNRPRVGQTAHCFTGMRTRRCRRLGAWPIDRVVPVMLTHQGVWIGDRQMDEKLRDLFAAEDGFASWDQMRDWFDKQHGLPFRGDLVQWKHNNGRTFDAPKETP